MQHDDDDEVFHDDGHDGGRDDGHAHDGHAHDAQICDDRAHNRANTDLVVEAEQETVHC